MKIRKQIIKINSWIGLLSNAKQGNQTHWQQEKIKSEKTAMAMPKGLIKIAKTVTTVLFVKNRKF